MNEMMHEMDFDNADKCPGEQEDRTYPPTIAGWSARIVSLCLLFALVGTIGWQAIQPEVPVTFTAEMKTDEIRELNGSYLVPVDITNMGSETALNATLDLLTDGKTTQIKVPMIGQRETLRFVISAPEKPVSVGYRIVSYEAP